MQTFDQLTEKEQQCALQQCVNQLLSEIIKGGMRFNDALNHDRLQARIDAAIAEAEKEQTPWFAGEFIMEVCREEIEGMAWCDAKCAFYPGPEDVVIKL